MIRTLLAAAILMAAACGTALAENEPTHRFVDRSIGGFTLGESDVKMVSIYGEGSKYDLLPYGGGRSTHYTRCYFFPEERTYLVATINRDSTKIESMELANTRETGCVRVEMPVMPLETGKQVRLGMKMLDVLSAYGKPETMSIEELTPKEIKVFAKRRVIPEGMSAEEFAKSFTEKRKIPKELGLKDFAISFSKPEKILGLHKTAIYEWDTNFRQDPGVAGFYRLSIRYLRERIIKIEMSDEPEDETDPEGNPAPTIEGSS